MSITFKRFHADARLSQETCAYDTDVLFEGKLIGHCDNDGRGGEGRFHASELARATPGLLAQADAWAKQQAYHDPDGAVATDHEGKPLIVGGIAEYCDLLAEESLAYKQEMAQIKRHMKAKTLISDPAREGDIFAIKTVYRGQATQDLVEKHYPGAIVLNALTADDALKLFREQSRRVEARAKAESAVVEEAPAVESASAPRKGRGMKAGG